jgi:hypothetical protein
MAPNFQTKETQRKYLQLFPKETKERGPLQGNMNLNLYLTHKITCIHFLAKQKREKKKEITGTHFPNKEKERK